MRNRRWIAGLSIFSSVTMGAIGLFQMGILRRLPEPPSRVFNSKRVNGSAQAYQILDTPDALLGCASYAITACLAGASAPDRARTAPLVPLAMVGKLLADAALAAKLTFDEWTRYRALCFLCLLSAGATFASAALAVPEVRNAIRHLETRGSNLAAAN
jgi:uncharacterized membrane protein